MTKQTSVASGDGFAEFLSGMWRRTDQQERGDLPRCGVRLKTNPEKSPFIGSLLFVIPGLIVAIYGIYDAYATAKADECRRDPVPGNVIHMIFFWFFGIAALLFLAAIVVGLASGAS